MKLLLVLAFSSVICAMPANETVPSLGRGQLSATEHQAATAKDSVPADPRTVERGNICAPKDYLANSGDENDGCRAACINKDVFPKYDSGSYKPGKDPQCHCHCLRNADIAFIQDASAAAPAEGGDGAAVVTTPSPGNSTTAKNSSGITKFETIGILSILCSLGTYFAY